MKQHPSGRHLELYVLGALDRDDADRLEHHVSACAPCAAALGTEARFEVTLQALVVPAARGGTVVALPTRPPPSRPAYSGAAAAVIALLVGFWGIEATRLSSAPSTAPALAAPTEGEAPLVTLACELAPAEPMCPRPADSPQPTARQSLPAAAFTAGICRPPAGGICRIQSRGTE